MNRSLILLALVFSSAVSVAAQDNTAASAPACIREADQILNIGDKIRLTSANGHFVEGYLAGISYESSYISIGQRNHKPAGQNHIAFSDIDQISYYKRGKLKPLYILGGFVGGILVGGFIGTIAGSHSDEMFGQIDAAATGAGIGAMTGIALGFACSVHAKKLVEIKCDF